MSTTATGVSRETAIEALAAIGGVILALYPDRGPDSADSPLDAIELRLENEIGFTRTSGDDNPEWVAMCERSDIYTQDLRRLLAKVG